MSDRMSAPYADEFVDDDADTESTDVTPWMPQTEARMTVELTSLLVQHAHNLEGEGKTAMARVYRRHAKDVANRYRERLVAFGREVKGPPSPTQFNPVPEVATSHPYCPPSSPGSNGVGRCARCHGTRRAHDPAFYAQRDAEWSRRAYYWLKGRADGEECERTGSDTWDPLCSGVEAYLDGFNCGIDNAADARRRRAHEEIWGGMTAEQRRERFMDLVDQLGPAAYQYEEEYR